MLSLEQIKNGVSIIAVEYPIKKAELFGFYAKGSNIIRSISDSGLGSHGLFPVRRFNDPKAV